MFKSPATARVRTQHGATYQSSRAVGEAPRVSTAVCSPDALADSDHLASHDGASRESSSDNHAPASSRAGLSLDGELFKIEVYSQNQIESIAQSPRAQLTLIDKFIERDIRRIEERLDDVTRRLAQNAAASVSLAREIESDEDRTRELPAVTESLRALEHASGGDGGHAAAAARAHAAKTARGAWAGGDVRCDRAPLRVADEDRRARHRGAERAVDALFCGQSLPLRIVQHP